MKISHKNAFFSQMWLFKIYMTTRSFELARGLSSDINGARVQDLRGSVEAGTESYKRDKAKASSARQNDTREEQSKLKS